MNHLPDTLFQHLLDQFDEPRIMIRAISPAYPVLMVNAAYEQATQTRRAEVQGISIWEIFKPDGAGNYSLDVLRKGLREAAITGRQQRLPAFRYATTPEKRVKAEPAWWQIDIAPLLNEEGAVAHLLCTTRLIDIHQQENPDTVAGREAALLLHRTEQQDADEKARHSVHDTAAALATMRLKGISDSEYRLGRIVHTTPIGLTIFKGREFRIDLANQPVLRIWGRSAEDVIGRKLMDVFPELEGQPFPGFLNSVMDTGKPVAMSEIPVTIVLPNGQKNDIYVDFSYDPLYDERGTIDAVLVSVKEITESVIARQMMQQQQEELETMNEEISSTNEELAATNEELLTTNEDLHEAQLGLLKLYEDFVQSKLQADRAQDEFKLAVSTADLGTWSIDMQTRRLSMSDRLIEIFGLQPDSEVHLDDLIPVIDPEYKDFVVRKVLDGLDKLLPMDIEYPATHALTQKRVWVRTTGKAFLDPEGRPKHFSGIIMDITERKLDDIRKNDFISIVSHELKTPITSIKGYLQLMNRQAVRDGLDFYRSLSEKALGGVGKMEAMVKGFLNVSRLGSGKIYLDMELFSLHKILEAAVDEHQALSPGHRFDYRSCEDVELYADKEKIAQVLNNLLSNAIKYSYENSTIHISCALRGDLVEVRVRDEGKGIMPHDISRLFDRFYRVEDPSMSHITGFGIGLYLCAEIIQRHNGQIRVESELNVGSTFSFTLPLRKTE